MAKKHIKRVDAAVKLVGILSNEEKTIEELTEVLYMHVNADTTGRCYMMLSTLLESDMVTVMVKNRTKGSALYWKLKK